MAKAKGFHLVNSMKGLILAGGSGTRLHPLTLSISKQLLPVYNKPMIYYPLSVLMLAGIREILIITTPEQAPLFQQLLGDGANLGLMISYAEQKDPKGLADAFLIGEKFIGDDEVCLILGDNILHGNSLIELIHRAKKKLRGAALFAYHVKDPTRYGVVTLNQEGRPISIEEKPKNPKSDYAVTGLYFYDNRVVEMAKSLTPSARGELEITDINSRYIQEGDADVYLMGRGYVWLDAGTYDSLMQAGQYMQVVEERQGIVIAALEEIAYRQGFIDKRQLMHLAEQLGNAPYGHYLLELANA